MSLGALIAAADVAPDPAYDPVLDAKLKCPRESPNVKAYIEDLTKWLRLAKDRHADWTDEQIKTARQDLYVKHHCAPGEWHGSASPRRMSTLAPVFAACARMAAQTALSELPDRGNAAARRSGAAGRRNPERARDA
jgi:hypothetical protein